MYLNHSKSGGPRLHLVLAATMGREAFNLDAPRTEDPMAPQNSIKRTIPAFTRYEVQYWPVKSPIPTFAEGVSSTQYIIYLAKMLAS